jgi:hypothetical protein
MIGQVMHMIFWIFKLGFKIGDPVTGIRLLLFWLLLQKLILHLQLTDIVVQSCVMLS